MENSNRWIARGAFHTALRVASITLVVWSFYLKDKVLDYYYPPPSPFYYLDYQYADLPLNHAHRIDIYLNRDGPIVIENNSFSEITVRVITAPTGKEKN